MNNLPNPQCAVVIPAFNAARYLEEAVESALAVRAISIEIIIVDDGSSDETPQIASSLARLHANVKYICQANAGVSAARNAGFALAKSEYVCFLDSDDCFRKGGLEAMHQLIVDYPDAVGVYGDVRYFDENSEEVDFSSKYEKEKGPVVTNINTIMQGNLIDTPGAIVFRSSKLIVSGLFDRNIYVGEDWELYVRIARLGDFVHCNRPVLDYRVHQLSAMSRAVRFEDYEPAVSRVFSDVHYPDIDHSTLRLYELRKTAGIFRLLVLRSRGIKIQMCHLRSLVGVCVRSRLDELVVITTAKSLLSASKRLI
jgi:glycosyltransferase involved in cell wall biosynthesis